MQIEVEWLELSDIGVGTTHEQRVLLDRFLAAAVALREAEARLGDAQCELGDLWQILKDVGTHEEALRFADEMAEKVYNYAPL